MIILRRKLLQEVIACNRTLIRFAVRNRHSMTNLYETLGVANGATNEDIENAYSRLKIYYEPTKTSDPNVKIYFDDLTLAYNTLINQSSRQEYDEYISQHIKLSHMWKQQQGVNEHEDEDAQRRKSQRGKRRFEDGFEFVNDEFYQSWQSRTKKGKEGASSFDFGFDDANQKKESTGEENEGKDAFNGKNINIILSTSFQEALHGALKTIQFPKEIKCDACGGQREAKGSSSSVCYSCKGEGIKEDPLFHKQSKCNTCEGHGRLVKNPCTSCKGEGYTTKMHEKSISIPKFTEHNEILQFEHEGHETTYLQKGEDGHLQIKVQVENDPRVSREGLNIISKHYITLTDALLGCKIDVDTVKGKQGVSIASGTSHGDQHVFEGKGVHHSEKGKGDHIAEIKIVIPQNLNQESVKLFEEFQQEEAKINHLDPEVAFYDYEKFETKSKQNDKKNNNGSFFSRFGL